MSADNQITIRQKDKVFYVYEHCIEYPGDESNQIGKASTLPGAIAIAEDYPYELEYGFRFELLKQEEEK